MAEDEQEREAAGSSPVRKPSNRVVRGAFDGVATSAAPPGGGIIAFAAFSLVVATAAGAFVT